MSDDFYTSTDIESAIIQGDSDEFDELIDEADIEHRSGNGSTLLHKTVGGNEIDLARKLIDRDIEIDARDSEGKTALHRAVELEQWELVETLLDHDADPNTVDTYGGTPLHDAIGQARPPNVQLLLEHGADPHHAGEAMHTPVEMARDLEYDDITELLVQASDTAP